MNFDNYFKGPGIWNRLPVDGDDGEKLTMEEYRKRKSVCDDCLYRSSDFTKNKYAQYCDYLEVTGHRRPCKGPLHSGEMKCECYKRATKEQYTLAATQKRRFSITHDEQI